MKEGDPDGESFFCTGCGDEAVVAERVPIGVTEGQFCEDCLAEAIARNEALAMEAIVEGRAIIYVPRGFDFSRLKPLIGPNVATFFGIDVREADWVPHDSWYVVAKPPVSPAVEDAG
jgi:hypothetical protein